MIVAKETELFDAVSKVLERWDAIPIGSGSVADHYSVEIWRGQIISFALFSLAGLKIRKVHFAYQRQN